MAKLQIDVFLVKNKLPFNFINPTLFSILFYKIINFVLLFIFWHCIGYNSIRYGLQRYKKTTEYSYRVIKMAKNDKTSTRMD